MTRSISRLMPIFVILMVISTARVGVALSQGLASLDNDPLHQLPATNGKISHFSSSDVTGICEAAAWGELLGESCGSDDATKYWYLAMRWPYVNGATDSEILNAKSWWHNKKILVTNPSNGKQVVLEAKDWGPNENTGRVIDVSKTALDILGAVTDNIVNIEFANQDSNMGPIKDLPVASSDWPMYRKDVSNTGNSLETISLPLIEQWHSNAPLVEENGAVVSNGIVYMSTADGKLYAFDVSTGAIIPGFPVTTSASYGSPAVDPINEKVYVLAGGKLYAVGFEGLLYKWTKDVGTVGTNYNQGPIIDDGYVYVKAGGNLIKYNSNGVLQWSSLTSGTNTQPSILGRVSNQLKYQCKKLQ